MLPSTWFRRYTLEDGRFTEDGGDRVTTACMSRIMDARPSVGHESVDKRCSSQLQQMGFSASRYVYGTTLCAIPRLLRHSYSRKFDQKDELLVRIKNLELY